jgi:hypothetical protein|tara:strand:- start:394 stop:621 length:228 start_codon:yes stop_codon:yes gene_type:complete
MPKEDEQFLKDRLSMMESEGWLDLIEDLKDIERGILNIDALDNENDLFNAKGQLHIIRFLLSLEDATKFTLEQSQ